MTASTWHDRAAAVTPDGRALIGGQRVWALGGQQFDNRSPIDGRSLGMVARCDGQDIDAAVTSARPATRRDAQLDRKSVV